MTAAREMSQLVTLCGIQPEQEHVESIDPDFIAQVGAVCEQMRVAGDAGARRLLLRLGRRDRLV